MKKLFLILVLASFCFAQTPDPGPPTPSWDQLMDYVQNGQYTMTYKTLTSPTLTSPSLSSPTLTGTVTLANDETITNTPDGTVSVTANDDGTTLLTFTFASTNAGANLSDNDKIVLNIITAYNDSGDVKSYATIEGIATDVSQGTEDGRINLKVMINGTSTIAAYVLGDDLYSTDDITVGDDLVVTDDADIGGNVNLENNEKILNSTDAEFEILFDDNAATLGSVIINTSIDRAGLANNDLFEILFRAYDGGNNEQDYVKIEAQITDTTATSEDSRITFKTLEGGASKSPLVLTGSGAAFAGIMTIANGITTGTQTFDTGAAADTAVVSGVTATKSIVWSEFTTDPGSPGAHWTEAKDGGLIIINTDAAVTATPTWRWFRVEIP